MVSTTATPPEPRIVRITNHGKIRHWVTKSLEFIEDPANADQPLILHTLPFTPASDANEKEEAKTKGKGIGNVDGKGIPPATLVVPRLISVVEIIKREYLRRLGENKGTRMEGLYQYNEIGCLEGLQEKAQPTEEERLKGILRALEGKNHVKLTQTPYMRVTLSLKPVEGLVEKGATFQPPTKRKLSKSAKARAKKREKKTTNVEGVTAASL